MCPVVVWCDFVGDLQWRKDPLSCPWPAVPHPAAKREAETRETSQRSLCHRDVSVYSDFIIRTIIIIAVSLSSVLAIWVDWRELYRAACHLIHCNWLYTFPLILTQFWSDVSMLEGGPRGEANLLTTVVHCGEATDIHCWLHWTWYGATEPTSRSWGA